MTTTAATATLTDWVKDLAKELWGKNWSPNCDTITHLRAQQTAKRLTIQWGPTMTDADRNRIAAAMKAK